MSARRTLAALAFAAAMLSAFPVPAAAECDPVSGVWPAFRDVAPTAPTIVTGEVVALLDTSRAATSPGASPLDWKFQLRVDDKLRGTSDHLLTFDQGIFAPGSTCLPPLSVGLHDRLALAIGAGSGDGRPEVLAAAYLYRELAATYPVPDGMAISEAEVETIAARPATKLPVLIVGGLVLAAFVLATYATTSRPKRQTGALDGPQA